jgi:ubiquinone/menaquinone biosynthesis C-methylase UbiE
MSHKFSAKDKNKLDNPERRKILPPEITLEKLQLQTGDIVADVGCGIGYFSIPAAVIVGEMGKVYAMDISDEMLREVQERAREKNVANIEMIKTFENSLIVADESITYVFICNVLHETENISSFLEEVKRILVGEGKVAIIDWMKKESHIGPPMDHRIAEEELLGMLNNMEFRVIEKIDIGNEFYGIVAVKN